MLQIKKLSSFDDLKGFDFSSVGFFQTSEYLQIFAKHFCKEEDVILLGIYDGDKIVGYGAFENINGIIKFLGMKKVLNGNEVTDYGDIVINYELKITNYELKEKLYKEIWERLLEWLNENGFKRAELDYTKNFQVPISKFQTKVVEEEVAPYVDLPESWEAYVSSLEYKNRSELRRKINRLEKEKKGKYLFSCMDTSIQNETQLRENFDEFVRLVKLSESEKEKFMTKGMEEFFWDLINIKSNWNPFLNFLQIDDRNAACILTFENGEEALAYNSGYDPEFIFFSPGFLSHAFKIKDLICRGYGKYDLLRGNERYKFDLGAKDEKLYKIAATV